MFLAIMFYKTFVYHALGLNLSGSDPDPEVVLKIPGPDPGHSCGVRSARPGCKVTPS
jgi:hypothetical protein